MKIKFMPAVNGYPKELEVDLEKKEKIVDDIFNIIYSKLKEKNFDKFVLPESRVVLKNGTGIGRIENNKFNVFDRYKGTKLRDNDKVAIIFPVSGG